MDYRINLLEKYNDNRGDLIVFLKESDLKVKERKFGQIYFVTFTKRGVVRGNHYHKIWREWFGIITGKVEVVLKDIQSQKQIKFTLDANTKKYTRLEIGPNIAHAFRSLTEEAALLNYSSEKWSSKDIFKISLIK